MHLLPCSRPTVVLEPAPRSALRADSAQERWEGFWGVENEAYYARCIRTDGSDQWYRLVDADHADAEYAGGAEHDAPRVLILRRAGVRRDDTRRMAISHARRGRTIMVGTWRHRPTSRAASAPETR
ncbi:MAG TPA: hypothetical protein VJ867_09005 [Gemmatimonadaceae bacterium]|nr:hypothetical protein [Gemmatimonadaceae bacterium]